MGRNTAEQARLRKAVDRARLQVTPDIVTDLIAAAEAMLPKREAWADFSVCDITVDTDKQTPMAALTYDGYIQALVSLGEDYLADRDQAIRAAVLLKHSKRLMEAWGEVETDKVRDEINAEAERLIGEPRP